jgi:hypothetical protein
MLTTPAQPDLLQYPISDLYLFTNYASRSAYMASTDNQAPPFNPALPIKGWADPAPSGQPYLMFDAAAPPAYTVELAVPAPAAGAVNLPGAYNYPAYVSVPTVAEQQGPYGPLGPVPVGELCMQADAQTLANALAPLYPGATLTVVDNTPQGMVGVNYGTETRRMWGIAISGAGPYGSIVIDFAETLIVIQNADGVGAPGHWMAVSNYGTPPTMLPSWVQDQQVTAAPANAVTLAIPIRALLPNERFVSVTPVTPFQSTTWMVARTDLQPTITLTEVQQLVAQYNAQSGVTAIAIG